MDNREDFGDMKKTVIGIAGNILIMDGGMFPGLERDYVNRDYGESISKAGACSNPYDSTGRGRGCKKPGRKSRWNFTFRWI